MPRLVEMAKSVHTWRWRRATLALALLLVLLVAPLQSPAVVRASSYSCTNHCYGVVKWGGSVDGAQMYMAVRGLNAGDGLVTNEMWLSGGPASGYTCPDPSGTNTCFVETGVTVGPLAGTSCSSDCYYWADLRTCQGCSDNYNEHYMANVGQGDYGNYKVFNVWRTGQGDFTVNAGPNNALSTDNNMVPNQIQIGMELVGTSGAWALQAPYAYNEWERNYNWQYQTVDGSPGTGLNANSAPISSYWQPSPSQDSSHSGGSWQTSCGC